MTQHEIPQELIEKWCDNWYWKDKDSLNLQQAIYLEGCKDTYIEHMQEIEAKDKVIKLILKLLESRFKLSCFVPDNFGSAEELESLFDKLWQNYKTKSGLDKIG